LAYQFLKEKSPFGDFIIYTDQEPILLWNETAVPGGCGGLGGRGGRGGLCGLGGRGGLAFAPGGIGGLGGRGGLPGLAGRLCLFLCLCTDDAPLPSAIISKGEDAAITKESNMIISLFIILKFLYTGRINNHARMGWAGEQSTHLTAS
jgi:hypothetical protein